MTTALRPRPWATPLLSPPAFSACRVGTAVTLEFRIESQPIEIEGISVEAMATKIRQPALIRNGFVKRALQGLGKFIAPWEIEASPAPTTSDLLMRTGRVTTRYRLGGDLVLMRGSRGYCVPTLYVDGVRTDLAYSPIDIVAPKFDLQALEVYRSSVEAPLQYGGGGGGCGVIMAWTKTAPTQPLARPAEAEVDEVVEVTNSSTAVVAVHVHVGFDEKVLGEVNPNQRLVFTLPDGAGEAYASGPDGSRMSRGVSIRRYKVDRATGKRVRGRSRRSGNRGLHFRPFAVTRSSTALANVFGFKLRAQDAWPGPRGASRVAPDPRR